MAFNPVAFRAELERSDLEWSVEQLASASGVSASTIRHWIAGIHKPGRPELDAVLAVLAFETCKACKGLGHVDPTQSKIRALEKRVAQPSQAVLRISIAAAVPAAVGHLVIDPAARKLSLDGAAVELTRSETAIVAALASNADRLLTSDELAQVACISGAGAVRTHVNRLKPKLARIGALAYLISGKGSGIALSAQCERAEQRSA